MPDELHERFKEACYWERKEMSELVRAWIQKYVEKVEKKPKSK
jgi:predicted DNA-binding protein